ncbi:Uncharacterized protein OBRU01_15644 [Operophtera brumata]|uniref:Sugar transporter n=1 Tax=Operophtera brumata TaxID=104452 RepID=A0A0L7L428_OPEBR|nr:Uncharacterized protein OBRU01_15644 [Operophtera brumata]
MKRRVQYLAGACASVAFVFTGATLAWSSPAIPKFRNGEANIDITDTSWVVSLHGLGALLGCYCGQVLNESVGRRRTIFSSSAPALVGAVTMIYITEISDKEIRGSLGMVVQVMNNLGSLIVYSIGPFVSYSALNAMVLSIPLCYVTLCAWIPESPYYHLKDGRSIDEEMSAMKAHVRESMENKTTMAELLTNVKYRKALQSGAASGPLASIVYGFVQLTAGICATFLTRYVGRRALMFASCLGVALSMTTLGSYFYLQDSARVGPDTLASLAALPLIGILGFNVSYANGIGNLPYVMQAELFPVNVKGVASSLATMLACVLSFIVTKSYQTVKDTFGHYTVFWSFALVGYSGVIFIYLFVPETRGKTLEEVLDNVQEAGKSPEEHALSEHLNEKRGE